MSSKKIRTGLILAALALGTAGTGAGVAAAGTAPHAHPASHVVRTQTTVFSDQVNYSGVAVPVGVAGSYSMTSNQCSLTSDTEPQVFPCKIVLSFSLKTLTGKGQVNSADGQLNWTFKLVPTPMPPTYSMVGTCTATAGTCYEIDSDGGTVVKYSAMFNGTVKLAPIPGSPNLMVTGSLTVSESPNSP